MFPETPSLWKYETLIYIIMQLVIMLLHDYNMNIKATKLMKDMGHTYVYT